MRDTQTASQSQRQAGRQAGRQASSSSITAIVRHVLLGLQSSSSSDIIIINGQAYSRGNDML